MGRRRLVAAIALATALTPWVTMAAVSGEAVFHSHHSAEPDSAEDFGAPLHGHRHEASTPEHQHFVVLPGNQSVFAAIAAAILGVAVLTPAPVALRLQTASLASRWHHGGLAPPWRARSTDILRI